MTPILILTLPSIPSSLPLPRPGSGEMELLALPHTPNCTPTLTMHASYSTAVYPDIMVVAIMVVA